MSSEVPIPEEAIAAGREAFVRCPKGRSSTRAAIEAAAPLIVAAAYRQLADEVEGQPVGLADLMGPGLQYNAGKGYVAGLLRRRAAELADWCNCQAVPGTENYPGPWHPKGDPIGCRRRASVLRGEGQADG